MNKKGFTLIEILAVLVVLSIVILITMPVVNNIVNDSRKNTFRISLESLIKVIKNDYHGNVRDRKVTYSLNENTLECIEGCPEGRITIKYKGDLKDARGRIIMNGKTIKFDDFGNEIYDASYKTKKCTLDDYKNHKTNCTSVTDEEVTEKCGSDGNLCTLVEYVLVAEKTQEQE